MRTPRTFVVIALACTASIGACGSSHTANRSGAAGGQAAPGTASGVAFATCMRAHGVPHFPDPAAPPPSLSGYSAVIRRGVYLAIPDTISLASPSYRRAAAACRFGPAFS
jgi:hypothetical protein